MPGQGGPVGHVGGVWQAQRLLYGRRGSRVLVVADASGLSAAALRLRLPRFRLSRSRVSTVR